MKYLESFGVTAGQGKYYEEVVYSMVLLYNSVHGEISTYLKKHDLTPAKLNALMTVKHQGGKQGISQVDISKRLIVTPSNMTRLLDKLEKEGLVHRGPQEGDRRVNIVKITEKGSKLLDAVWEGYIEKLKEIVSVLNPEEQQQMAHQLIQFLGRLKS